MIYFYQIKIISIHKKLVIYYYKDKMITRCIIDYIKNN